MDDPRRRDGESDVGQGAGDEAGTKAEPARETVVEEASVQLSSADVNAENRGPSTDVADEFLSGSLRRPGGAESADDSATPPGVATCTFLKF